MGGFGGRKKEGGGGKGEKGETGGIGKTRRFRGKKRPGTQGESARKKESVVSLKRDDAGNNDRLPGRRRRVFASALPDVA